MRLHLKITLWIVVIFLGVGGVSITRGSYNPHRPNSCASLLAHPRLPDA
jgi:hypothetical protein